MAYRSKYDATFLGERRSIDQLIGDLRYIAEHSYALRSEFIHEITTKAARRLRELQREVRKR